MAAVATFGALTAVAPAAHAAVTTLSFTDPAGDAGGYDPLDLLSGTVTYDDQSGALVASFTTKAPVESLAGASPLVTIGLGKASGTNCLSDASDGTTIGVFYLDAATLGVPESSYWSIGGSEDPNGQGNSNLAHAGTTTTLTPVDPTGALKGKSVSCLFVQTAPVMADGSGNGPVDTATGFVQSASTTPPSTGSTPTSKSSTTTIPITAPVTTAALDTDRDGTPDATDKCPAVPGAQKNGCPTMPPALEIRLGARRVVVDRLVLRTTATACPKLVRIHVKAKGKLIGNGVVSTSQFGSYCRVDGVIKTKKSVKAVRVTMASKGLASIAKSAHR